MKTLAILLIVASVVLVVITSISPGADKPKMMCPICEKEIKEGDVFLFKVYRGRDVKIHANCWWTERTKPLAELKGK